MSVRIEQGKCTKCGSCVAQCHLRAIHFTADGQYEIDPSVCDGCKGLLDVQCARVCETDCMVDTSTGEMIINILQDIPILRPDHLLYLVAVMGTGNSGRYTLRNERKIERSIIANAYLDPLLKVRIVPVFDDCCLSCPRKREKLLRDHLIYEDTKTAEFLGFKFGEVIGFWKAVQIAIDKFTPESLKSVRKADAFIKDYMNLISPE